MKFTVTLHVMPVIKLGRMFPSEDTPDDWKDTIKAALEQIPGVNEVEVEPEHIGGSGDQ